MSDACACWYKAEDISQPTVGLLLARIPLLGQPILYATSREVAGLRPDEVNEIFQFTESFWSDQALEFTQPPTEISTRSRNIMFPGSKVWTVLRADNPAHYL
jgi:hypothetical protein